MRVLFAFTGGRGHLEPLVPIVRGRLVVLSYRTRVAIANALERVRSAAAVELPAGRLTPQQVRRHVHAVLTAASGTRR